MGRSKFKTNVDKTERCGNLGNITNMAISALSKEVSTPIDPKDPQFWKKYWDRKNKEKELGNMIRGLQPGRAVREIFWDK